MFQPGSWLRKGRKSSPPTGVLDHTGPLETTAMRPKTVSRFWADSGASSGGHFGGKSRLATYGDSYDSDTARPSLEDFGCRKEIVKINIDSSEVSHLIEVHFIVNL
jgi:hypothetical protein